MDFEITEYVFAFKITRLFWDRPIAIIAPSFENLALLTDTPILYTKS
jgi:hypothetical protein